MGIWLTAAKRGVTHPDLHRLAVLIDNALKFSGSAEVVVRQEAGQVNIALLDRDPGIPPEEMYAVMQPFYRVENSRNRATR